MTNEERLKVLDMSEDEQWEWLIRPATETKTYQDYWPDVNVFVESRECYLADLAFRLRDEAVKDNHADFHEAIYDVMIKVEGNDNWATAFWGECIAKPIHWIIASLIAKGKSK